MAELWRIERFQFEGDDHFRTRIKLQLPKNTTRTTIDEILRVSTIMLDCDRSQITLVESHDIEPARFDVVVEEQVLRQADITTAEYVELLQDVKAAGVRVVATIGEQFTYRSAYEFTNGINDPERGYGDKDDPSVGGPYADIITARITAST